MQATNDQVLARQLLEVYRIFGMLEPTNMAEPANNEKAATNRAAAGDNVLASELGTQIVRASSPVVNSVGAANEECHVPPHSE